MSIEDAIGHLKVVDGDEPQPLSGSITIGGKLHLTQEQWEAYQDDRKKWESPPSMGSRKRGKRHKSRGRRKSCGCAHAKALVSDWEEWTCRG
jgi:hypothetical protein